MMKELAILLGVELTKDAMTNEVRILSAVARLKKDNERLKAQVVEYGWIINPDTSGK